MLRAPVDVVNRFRFKVKSIKSKVESKNPEGFIPPRIFDAQKFEV